MVKKLPHILILLGLVLVISIFIQVVISKTELKLSPYFIEFNPKKVGSEILMEVVEVNESGLLKGIKIYYVINKEKTDKKDLLQNIENNVEIMSLSESGKSQSEKIFKIDVKYRYKKNEGQLYLICTNKEKNEYFIILHETY